jgi:2-polyprenyl-3-methyl-5-hydroxy-6-metoxy-1,4-benzoquinol methylase
VTTSRPATGGNVYDKYRTRHPVERRLVEGFVNQLAGLVARTGATEVHEVGCGEGELLLRLAAGGLWPANASLRGSDVSTEVIEEARRRAGAAGVDIRFKAASIHGLDPVEDSAELVLCCEVLEHLDDPVAGLEVAARLARPWLVVSVPREPLWRALNLARLKYVKALGNTPGHRQHWSRRAFLDFLDRRVELVDVRRPLPWTMALCRAA